MGSGFNHSDRWLNELRRNATCARSAVELRISKEEADELLNSDVEVLAYENGRVAVMRMPAEELERCLIEYRHIPWRVLAIRPLLFGRNHDRKRDEGGAGDVCHLRERRREDTSRGAAPASAKVRGAAEKMQEMR